MKILVFGAHPDDVEFGCGGVLVVQRQLGHEIKIICLSRGEAGTAGTPEDREQEARNAAKVMGVSIEFMDFGGDSHIQHTIENRIRIARSIREYRPDMVLAPTLDGNQHPDHRTVAEIVRDALRLARYGGLDELKDLPVHKVSTLLHFPVTSFFAQSPDMIIDVSNAIETWKEAMLSHDSQMKNKNYMDLIMSRARSWGLIAGVEYGIGLWKSDPILLDNLNILGKSARGF